MVQALWKIPIHLDKWSEYGLSMASFSAHKSVAHRVGALWATAGRQVKQLIKGGGQEKGDVLALKIFMVLPVLSSCKISCNWQSCKKLTEWRSNFVSKLQRAYPENVVTTRDAECVIIQLAFYCRTFPHNYVMS